MPKYYLHVINGDNRTQDLEGAEYDDLSSARDEARESAIDLVCDSLRAGHGLGLQRSIVIASEDGQAVEELSFALAVRPNKI